jgi:GNAT superfamily N-acetyltransferase
MNISKMTKADLEGCVQPFMAAYNQLPWNYDWTEDKAKLYLQEYLEAPNFVGFIAEEGGEVAGALLAHSRTWWTGNQLYVDELFVSSAKQGAGYGRALLETTETYAKENGFEMLTLMTNKFMPALKFYFNNDYNKVDQYVFLFKEL